VQSTSAQTCGTGLKILAQLIRRQLRLETNEFGYCAIYENELQRVWQKMKKIGKQKSRGSPKTTDSG
jgi:hypothetical protein